MSKPSWTRIRKKLESLDKPALIGVIKELYQLSANNKAMIARDFDAQADEDPLAPKTMKAIDACFDPEGGKYLSFQIAPARKALREYCKAVSAQSAIAMHLYYVQAGIKSSHRYGGINERFYDSLESVYQETIKRVLAQPEPEAYRQKLEDLMNLSEGIAWGFYDAMVYLFSQYVAVLGED